MLDKLDKLSGREKGALAIMLVFVLAALANWFVVRPLMESIAECDRNIENEKRNVAVARACEARMESVGTRYGAVQVLLGRATATALNDMRGEIDRLAREHFVEVPTMQNRDPVRSPSCTEYAVELTGIGCTASNLLGFINAMESSPGMLRVSKMVLNPGKDDKGVTVKGSMTITKVLIAPDEEAAPEPQK